MKTTALEEFKKISAVPRRSYHNEKIVAYCLEHAKELGFETYYDEKNVNVLIRRPASSGKEDRPGIVLQGHLDMVEQTDAGVDHDWDNDGLELVLDGDTLTANGTTLGADNGVAAAIAFALLQDETLKNPPLEVLLTTNEEVGMDSVKNADLSYLQGKYLFNLDGGGEGCFITGCCGGQSLKIRIPEEKEEVSGAAYTLTVTGLNGGHSGIEIGTERANALKVLGQLFFDLAKKYELYITDIIANGKDNAICKEAKADIVIKAFDKTDEPEMLIRESEKKIRQIFRLTDPDLSVQFTAKGSVENLLSYTKEQSRKLTVLLQNLPFGVLHHDQSLDGNIETSCNLGLVEKDEKGNAVIASIRSSVAERIKEVTDQITSLAALCGGSVESDGKAYPAWLPDPSSPLIPLFKNKYYEMYGKEAFAGPIHAGLECGYILSNSNLEAAISAGPDIADEHTTNESL
ncbi:MAG: beta-Ala-His dipeptidase, partial [Lachnospiraceae bacterium]|nr:beta-Ala-His dipeptidase [Lachnospiraceae bacterium]